MAGGGSVGTISEAEVHVRIGALLGLDAERVDAFMDDIWTEDQLRVPLVAARCGVQNKDA